MLWSIWHALCYPGWIELAKPGEFSIPPNYPRGVLRPNLLWLADIGSIRLEIGGDRWIDGASDRLILVVCVESIGRLDDRGGGSLGLLPGFLFA